MNALFAIVPLMTSLPSFTSVDAPFMTFWRLPSTVRRPALVIVPCAVANCACSRTANSPPARTLMVRQFW